jgi:hypothetical protein
MIYEKPKSIFMIAGTILILSIIVSLGLAGCSPLAAVDYALLPKGDWNVSTPEEQGLDPKLLDKLYADAAELGTLYGLLVGRDHQPAGGAVYQIPAKGLAGI